MGCSLEKPSPHQRQSFGLEGIQERVGIVAGSVRFTSAKGKGMKVEVTVPVERVGLETLRPLRPQADSSALSGEAAPDEFTSAMA